MSMMEKNDAVQVGFDEDTAPKNFDFDDLDSDQQTAFRMVIDDSASMEEYESEVADALDDVKNMILGSKQVDEMVLAKSLFGDRIEHGPYCLVEDWDTSYKAVGWSTKLYDAIIEAVDDIKAMVDDFQSRNFTARGVLTILSDGKDNDSRNSKKKAREAIEKLQDTGITVYYIEFGPNARGIAKDLGIKDEYILKPGAQAASAEERRKQLRAAFKFVSKSAISVSQGGAAPVVDNGMFGV